MFHHQTYCSNLERKTPFISADISNWISILSLPFMALAPTNYQQQLKLTFCNINISKPRKSLWDKIVIRKELKSYLMAFCEI